MAAIAMAGVFAPAMANGMGVETPFRQPVVNVVCVGIDPGAWRDESLNQRLDRRVLDVLQHPDHHRPTALDHAEDRRFFTVTAPAAPPAEHRGFVLAVDDSLSARRALLQLIRDTGKTSCWGIFIDCCAGLEHAPNGYAR